MFYGAQYKIGFHGVATVDLRCCNSRFKMLQHVFLNVAAVDFKMLQYVATIHLKCCDMFS
jgi:hypothetical protein